MKALCCIFLLLHIAAGRLEAADADTLIAPLPLTVSAHREIQMCVGQTDTLRTFRYKTSIPDLYQEKCYMTDRVSGKLLYLQSYGYFALPSRLQNTSNWSRAMRFSRRIGTWRMAAYRMSVPYRWYNVHYSNSCEPRYEPDNLFLMPSPQVQTGG